MRACRCIYLSLRGQAKAKGISESLLWKLTHRRAYIAHGLKNTRRTQNHTLMSSHNVPIHPLRDIEGDHHHLSGEWAPMATATGTHRHL